MLPDRLSVDGVNRVIALMEAQSQLSRHFHISSDTSFQSPPLFALRLFCFFVLFVLGTWLC